jgi:hypothetical protein
VFDDIYGAGKILNLTSADMVSLPSFEFADFSHLFAAAKTSGADVLITASDSDTLDLKNTTLTQLQGMSQNFTFHP